MTGVVKGCEVHFIKVVCSVESVVVGIVVVTSVVVGIVVVTSVVVGTVVVVLNVEVKIGVVEIMVVINSGNCTIN